MQFNTLVLVLPIVLRNSLYTEAAYVKIMKNVFDCSV